MEPNTNRTLRERLQLEVAERSPRAAATFALVALMVIIHPFVQGGFYGLIRLGASIAFLASAYRWWRSRALIRENFVGRGDYRQLSIAIWLNALGWALAFGSGTYAALLKNESFLFPTFVMMGFATASVITLSSDRYLSQVFVTANLGSQLLALMLAHFVHHVPVEWELFLIYPILGTYLTREAWSLRHQLIARHINQMRLEIANRRLFRSRQELVEQTSRTVHASRLASLGEMAGGIAHEINNPLAIIHLSLESFQVQLRRTHTELDAKAQDILQRCQSAVNRISVIVRGLKNFSRTGEQDPLVAVTIRQLVQDTLGLCSEKLKAHQVKLELEGELDAEVLCRPVEIAQVLINLINNAFYVTIELPAPERRITLRAQREGRSVSLALSNTGAAIPQKVREKLFQPFFTTKPPGEGTGLGLSISRAIAKRHGGDLSLDVRAHPTTFVLRLPYHEPSSAPAEL